METIIVLFGVGAAVLTYVVCTVRADTKVFIVGNLFQTNFAKFGSKRVLMFTEPGENVNT